MSKLTTPSATSEKRVVTMDFAEQLLESSRQAAIKWQQAIENGATSADVAAAKRNYLMQLDQYHAILLGHGHCDIFQNLKK